MSVEINWIGPDSVRVYRPYWTETEIEYDKPPDNLFGEPVEVEE